MFTTAGLRRGNVRSGANAGWHVSRALARAADLAPEQRALLRADSALCTHESVAAAERVGAWFSITIPAWPTVTRAISHIAETGWTPIHDADAVWDEVAQAWISDAEVAGAPFTSFTSRHKAEQRIAPLATTRSSSRSSRN